MEQRLGESNQARQSATGKSIFGGLTFLRLRLRDLFFLTVIAAILVCWWQDREELRRSLSFDKQAQEPPHWQVSQTTGPPDTQGAGDIRTAWASETEDGQKEWLDLSYEKYCKPTQILIHETYNPGAVYKVSMFGWSGKEVVVWEGTDPIGFNVASGVAAIPIRKSFWTKRIKVYLDSPAVPGWNEIDAVGLVDKNGNKSWAADAKASSCYDDYLLGMSSRLVRVTPPVRPPIIIVREEESQ